MSGLMLVMSLKDRTEATLPDATLFDRSQPGPFQTLGLLMSNGRKRGKSAVVWIVWTPRQAIFLDQGTPNDGKPIMDYQERCVGAHGRSFLG